MFEKLQQKDIGLRRRPVDNAHIEGGSYTRHYTVNYGMQYKFIAATASGSFEGAAKVITNVRTRLNWTSRFIAQQQHCEFNEVLVLGYFKQQKINYHYDGEFGLGPTIKAKHYTGVSNAGIYDRQLPLPGCLSYEAHLAAVDELSHLEKTDSKVFNVRLKTLPKELNLSSRSHAKDAVTITLGHGDIVIMHRAAKQKYYEHSVDHAGKLRFALTCRYIGPGSLKGGIDHSMRYSMILEYMRMLRCELIYMNSMDDILRVLVEC